MKKVILMATVLLSSFALGNTISAQTAPSTLYPGDGTYGRISIGYDHWRCDASIGQNDMGFNGFYADWVVRAIPLSGVHPLYIEWGIKFNAGFYRDSYNYTDNNIAVHAEDKAHIYTFTVPINVTYHFPVGNSGLKFAPFAGINLKTHATAEEKITLSYSYASETKKETETIDPFSKHDMGDAALKRFQMGWQFGLNVDYKKLTLHVAFGTDFISIAKNCNTSNVTIGIGRNF